VSGPDGWIIERATGAAGALHAASGAQLDGASGPVGRRARVLEASRAAVVLGAAEPDHHVDRRRAERLGLEVARRRSGGGAVLVGPGEVLWVDLIVPRDDPLWSDDVGRATWWVGELWAGALGAVWDRRATAWRGPLVRTAWSDLVCFAGLGPGEVVVDGGQAAPSGTPIRAKVVGISQRRTRRGALFQCASLLRWRPADLLQALDLDPSARERAGAELAGAAVGIGAQLAPRLLEAVLSRLPVEDRATPG
jgi:lipoate-protein ligase A